MKIISLAPNSPDWERWRMAGIGSSDAPVILFGRHFDRTVDDLLEEKRAMHFGGTCVSRPMNGAMKRGKDQEAKIRVMYEEAMGVSAPPVCGVHDDVPFLKVSLDGWVHPPGIVVEIKRPGTRRDGSCDHDYALEGYVPDKYLPQIWHQCLVAGTRRAHYVSYGDARYGDRRFAVVPYEAPQSELDRLFELESKFWARVVSPSATEKTHSS